MSSNLKIIIRVDPRKSQDTRDQEIRSKEEDRDRQHQELIFTLNTAEPIFLEEDIEIGDLDQDNTDQDKEKSNSDLEEIKESML